MDLEIELVKMEGGWNLLKLSLVSIGISDV